MQVVDWIMAQGVEVTVPSLTDFIMQYFVNLEVNRKLYLETGGYSILIEGFLERYAERWNRRFERILKRFHLYEPSPGIHQKAAAAHGIVSLANQYGEGWLIPSEIAEFSDPRSDSQHIRRFFPRNHKYFQAIIFHPLPQIQTSHLFPQVNRNFRMMNEHCPAFSPYN